MILRSERLELRPIEEGDLEFIRELINDPEVEKTIVGWLWPLSAKDEQEWYKGFRNSNKEVRYLIALHDGTRLGLTGLTDMDWKNGRCKGTGIRISPQVQNKGYATEAYTMMLNYAFNQLRFHKVTDSALETNKASLRFLEKVGYKVEGVLRDHVFKNGKYCNVVTTSILAEDFNRLYRLEKN